VAGFLNHRLGYQTVSELPGDDVIVRKAVAEFAAVSAALIGVVVEVMPLPYDPVLYVSTLALLVLASLLIVAAWHQADAPWPSVLMGQMPRQRREIVAWFKSAARLGTRRCGLTVPHSSRRRMPFPCLRSHARPGRSKRYMIAAVRI